MMRDSDPQLFLFAVLLTAGCAYGPASRAPVGGTPPGSAPGPVASVNADPCIVVPQPDAPRDTVIVSPEQRSIAAYNVAALTGLGSGISTFVAAQLYEPLVTVSCDGRILGTLASEWSRLVDNAWTFRLRDSAAFSNGDRINANAVQASWAATSRNASAAQGWISPIESIMLRDDRTLTVGIREPQASYVGIFGNLLFAVRDARRTYAASEWPLGSGAFLIDSGASRPGSPALRPAEAGAIPVVRLRAQAGGDGRDLLDAGVDVLQTRDPAVLDYARRGSFGIHALPADRSYVILIAPQDTAPSSAVSASIDSVRAGEFRSALARDAARADSRPAQHTGWWNNASRCASERIPSRDTPTVRPALARLLYYEEGDAVAKALAERIVALLRGAGTGTASETSDLLARLFPRVTALDASRLIAAPADSATLSSGAGFAYIVHLPVRTTASCMEMSRLRNRAPWVSQSWIFSLVDTHASLITRAGAPAISVDFDGMLHILPRTSPRSGLRSGDEGH
jgi:hypothetical protein